MDRPVTEAGANGLVPEMKAMVWKIIEAAKASPVDALVRKAAEMEQKLRAARS